jgi:putative ubiquitin-RnfH superfamily antitoxin RatB of RatAB toxin-antitoxin module
MSGREIEVEVVYALPFAQDICRLRVPVGTTVAHVIERAGVVARHPEIDIKRDRVAVYGRLVSADMVLQDRDRVEILRPLNADPKEVRRRRASLGRLPG